jgi:hypothetical protein
MSEFKCKSRTKDEYEKVIETLKTKEGTFPKKRTKLELQHTQLREHLESKREAIDQELAVSLQSEMIL